MFACEMHSLQLRPQETIVFTWAATPCVSNLRRHASLTGKVGNASKQQVPCDPRNESSEIRLRSHAAHERESCVTED